MDVAMVSTTQKYLIADQLPVGLMRPGDANARLTATCNARFRTRDKRTARCN